MNSATELLVTHPRIRYPKNMAERISPADVTFRRRGAPRLYPWDQWADGSMWHLRQGTDYLIPTRDFRSVCYSHAKRNGLKVHVRTVDYGVVVVFTKPAEASQMTTRQTAGPVRYFATDTAHSHVVALTQNEIDEDPRRIEGLTEMRLIVLTEEAA